ncbi:hypothetical protein [Flavobacterium muglaense]|uniref:Uncharacterized protein n=1 Tax=Flavobacterium muglaense TaxID=2764716 RepID=A0A923N324_9FLAO|nr:hypothetical protein [Flavobacterium muglaense]MBC5838616.1 hypothetical protein [Flavobacterium muglaense]MBC5845150.1 hypothetical protein [Flavobacterium muglaense]
MKNEIQMETVAVEQSSKTQKLLLGILFDGLGMVSYTVPFLGEFSDVIWAPIAGLIMTKMYKGQVGKVAGYIAFFEELIPFTDVIPTFTLTWIYTYIIKKEK